MTLVRISILLTVSTQWIQFGTYTFARRMVPTRRLMNLRARLSWTLDLFMQTKVVPHDT